MTKLLQDEKTNASDTDYEQKQKFIQVQCKSEIVDEGETTTPEQGLRASLQTIFANKNYATFLATAWVFSSFNYLGSYFNLYLRAIGWEVVIIGGVLSFVAVCSSIFRLAGGYLGDIVDRKKIAVSAFLVLSIYYICISVFLDFWLIVITLLIYSLHTLFRSGSSAYILENVPREHGGFALSLFTAGRGLSIISLIAFGILWPMIGFPETFRLLYFIAGLCLILSSAARAYFLEPSARKQEPTQRPLFREFYFQNRKAIGLLLTAIPGLITVVVLDTISDSLFKTVALIYANEVLAIDLGGINLILVFQLLISIPLLLKMGRVSDRKGVKRAAILVYSVMPISAGLLYIAPVVPVLAPLEFINAANSLFPSLGVIFTTPFVAIVMKYVNDSLWAALTLILIRKKLPQTDTAKILSIFWVIVYVLSSIGPVIAGAIYTFLIPSFVFLVVLVMNLLILVAIAKGPFGNDSKPTTEDIDIQEYD
ncbi:MAG: MFS transporter [Candidatus Thorarchaeota archaeon]|nr:MFS transporter [Candidatus Thorarchaeota archaeon]